MCSTVFDVIRDIVMPAIHALIAPEVRHPVLVLPRLVRPLAEYAFGAR